MKIVSIISLLALSIINQVWAMDQTEIKPLSTSEWLFGYRSYTPQEQKFVNALANLEPRTSILIDQWFRATFKKINERNKMAKKIIEFIEIKNLEANFPNLYHTARSILKVQSIDPEEQKVLEKVVSGGKVKTMIPVSKANIQKGLHPDLSVEN